MSGQPTLLIERRGEGTHCKTATGHTRHGYLYKVVDDDNVLARRLAVLNGDPSGVAVSDLTRTTSKHDIVQHTTLSIVLVFEISTKQHQSGV